VNGAGHRFWGRFGWYKRIHARLIASVSERHGREVESWKRDLVGPLRGTVLEIGPGTGANLRFLSPDVTWIGIEPNRHMEPYLMAEADRLGIAVRLEVGVAEQLPFADGSIDAVLASLVLCTVRDVPRALQEIRRVLRPGGRFVFIEHVAAPSGTWVRRVQRLVRRPWGVLGDGCHPDRETWRAIEAAGFQTVELAHFRIPVPILGPHIAGLAIR
jgi:ubiquinone/menaquinone biosynthesis C-methylase UbiE